MLQGARKRTAMTLVELLVVMAIIVIFTAMTAAFYPANQADRELSRFSNTVQSALLSARNRAKAERLPTGIRFYADPNFRTKVGSVVLIQKPAPTLGSSFGNIVITEYPTGSGNFFADLTRFPQDPLTGKRLITGDEFFQLPNGDVGQITLITLPDVPPGLPAPFNVVPAVFYQNQMSSGFANKLQSAPSLYTIFRNPIELSGDTPFELSNTIEIQMPNTPLYRLEPTGQHFLTALPSKPPFTFTPSFTQATYFPPQRPGPPPIPPLQFPSPPTYMEIIFNPDGTLNNSTNDVYLHLHNFESLFGTGPSYSDGNFSRDAILAVRKMAGSIGVYEVGQMINFTPIPPSQPNSFLILYDSAIHNPTLFAKDPRNKGI